MSKALRTIGTIAGAVALTLAIPGAGAALGLTPATTATVSSIASPVTASRGVAYLKARIYDPAERRCNWPASLLVERYRPLRHGQFRDNRQWPESDLQQRSALGRQLEHGGSPLRPASRSDRDGCSGIVERIVGYQPQLPARSPMHGELHESTGSRSRRGQCAACCRSRPTPRRSPCIARPNS